MIDGQKISTFPVKDVFKLFEYIKDNKVPVSTVWKFEICHVRIWAKNGVIEHLQSNSEFWENFWESSTKDGVHTFVVDPKKIGFKYVADFCKDNGMVRQNIYNSRYKFDLVYESPKKVWVRKKDKIEKL